MKKFLSMLLALTVVFTYTFGAAGSVFAATYSLEDYSNALQNEKTAQLGYLSSAKAQAISKVTFDKYGFDTFKYSKAAYEAAADAVIADLSKSIDAAIKTYLEGKSFPMGTPAELDTVRDVTTKVGTGTTVDATTAAGMKALIDAKENTDKELVLAVAQAPLTKKFVEDKLAAVDLSKYNSTDKDYTIDAVKVTAAEKVQSLIDGVKDAIANEESSAAKKTAANKVNDYYALYFGGTLDSATSAITGFKADLAGINTLEDEAAAGVENTKTVEGAAKAFVGYALNKTNGVYPLEEVVKGTELYDLSAKVAGDYKAFYEAAFGSKKATVFGVEVGNIKKVTKAELTAINEALYKAIIASEDVLKNTGLKATEIVALYNDKATCLTTINNAMNVAEKYGDVEKYAASLKGAYDYGIKRYDDAKVDAALATAKKLVYADVKASKLDKAETYLVKAIAANEGVAESDALKAIELANFDAQKFANAKADAKAKMYKKDGRVQTKVLYGEDKTPEADFVYLQGTYDDSQRAEWTKIATKAVKAINAAQNYAAIDTALEAAKADFSKLMLKDDATKVKDARTAYKAALAKYKDTAWALVDSTKYEESTFNAAVTAGQAVIDKANTVDDVKAAYEKAKAMVDASKSKAELAAAKAEIEAKINALPVNAALTAADLATVKAVVDAYAEYNEIPGRADIATADVLKAKYEEVIRLNEEEIALAAKALNKKMNAVGTWSDADVAAYVALKAEAEEIKAKGEALLDEIDAVNEDKVFSTDVTGGTTLGARTDFEAIVNALDVTMDNGFWDKEIDVVETMLVKAGQTAATEADMKAALEAFNKLTDAQKYELTAGALTTVKVIENRLAETKYGDTDAKADLLDMARKITVKKVTKKSVKVTVTGSVANIKDNGYTVKYTFYKKAPGAKAFKAVKTTTSNKFVYKNLKKGTNKFQVKVSVYNAEGKLVASKTTFYKAVKVK
ncbi:MAG: hypothetical protein Q4E84_07310 [Clostridia bacterium]|nr:hypothetical protein [Clostridia bacterium]